MTSFVNKCKNFLNSLIIQDDNYKEYLNLRNLKNLQFIQNLFKFKMMLHIIILISNSFYYNSQDTQLFIYFFATDSSIILIFFMILLMIRKFQLKTLKYWNIIISVISVIVLILITELQLFTLISKNSNIHTQLSLLIIVISIISNILFFKLLITNLLVKIFGLFIEVGYILIRIDYEYYPLYPKLVEILGGFFLIFIFQERYDKDYFISNFAKLEQQQFWKYILNIIPNNVMIFSKQKSLLYCNDTLEKFFKKDEVNKSAADILNWKKLRIRQESLSTIKDLMNMMEEISMKPTNDAFEDKQKLGVLKIATKKYKSFKTMTNEPKDFIKKISKNHVISFILHEELNFN